MKEIRIEIPAPNDCHVHLRTGEMLRNVLAFHNVFENVVVMGNLIPPIVCAQNKIIYESEILIHKPSFRPWMTIMLVKSTTPKTIQEAKKAGVRFVKYIPEATSTGSDFGVPVWQLEDYHDVIDEIRKQGMYFLGHWEMAFSPKSKKVIPFQEREQMAIPYLRRLAKNFPNLKITVEHVSTKEMVKFVDRAPDNIRATITAHHIGPYYTLDLFNWEKGALKRNEIRKPDLFCLPILKGFDDALAVIKAMTSGNPKYMFGSDSAPHPPESKVLPNPRPGIFSAPTALSWIATIFDEFANMDVKLLKDFLCDNSRQWYDFPKSEKTITLVRKKWKVPKNYKGIVPFLAGMTFHWKISTT
jgi:dihydroorotase